MLVEPGRDDLFQRLDQRLVIFQLFDDLGNKGIDEHGPSLVFRNTARHQVEELRVVDIGNRRTVAALHVVGEDLQLRLRREIGVVG
ncbi:hypothetical protein D3C86_2022000 [compost metagenome]